MRQGAAFPVRMVLETPERPVQLSEQITPSDAREEESWEVLPGQELEQEFVRESLTPALLFRPAL